MISLLLDIKVVASFFLINSLPQVSLQYSDSMILCLAKSKENHFSNSLSQILKRGLLRHPDMVHQVIFLFISSKYHFHKNDFKKFLSGWDKEAQYAEVHEVAELNMNWWLNNNKILVAYLGQFFFPSDVPKKKKKTKKKCTIRNKNSYIPFIQIHPKLTFYIALWSKLKHYF